jgi:hypothetical protein
MTVGPAPAGSEALQQSYSAVGVEVAAAKQFHIRRGVDNLSWPQRKQAAVLGVTTCLGQLCCAGCVTRARAQQCITDIGMAQSRCKPWGLAAFFGPQSLT